MDEVKPATPLAPGTGVTGHELELDDQELLTLTPPRLDANWPEDSQGNKLSLGNSVVHQSNEMGPGVIRNGWREVPEDPPVSRAQNAAMHAAAEGHSTLGIPKSVGQEYVKSAHGSDVSHLPEHVRHKK
jgi:hypothetical protein